MAFPPTGENTQIRIFTLCDHKFQKWRSVLKFCEHNFFFQPLFLTKGCLQNREVGIFFVKKSEKSKNVQKMSKN
jgi:hypothetical protein